MLNKENRQDSYAYRIATRDIADPSTYMEDGSWVTLDSSGKLIPALATSKVAFLFLSSNRTGRNNIASQAVQPKGSYYLGKVEVSVTNNPDKGDTTFKSTDTYGWLTPLGLAVDATTEQAVLTTTIAADGATVAYSLGPASDGTLRIMTA